MIVQERKHNTIIYQCLYNVPVYVIMTERDTMNTLFTMDTITLEPKTFAIWAIDRESKQEIEFSVKAFRIKDAMEIARKAYTEKHPEGLRIRVCVEIEKFEQAKIDWLERLAKNKGNGKAVERLEKVAELVDTDTLEKIAEIFNISESLKFITK